MLFMIRHTHSPEKCPGAKGAESGRKFLNNLSEKEGAKEGIKVVGSYIAPSEHTLVVLVEANDLSKVEGFTFNRLALVGRTKITPVVTIKQALAGHPAAKKSKRK